MRILLLAWEYPPRIHGGLGRHVHALARALARAGHEVHVVAAGHPAAPAHVVADGVEVHRAEGAKPAPWPAPGWPQDAWLEEVRAVNLAMLEAAGRVAAEADVDVVHAHDWMVGAATAALLERCPVPLVVTVHATERGRHQGWLPGPLSRWIDERERRLVQAASQVIVCSEAMARQVADHLGVDVDAVIGNGVERSPCDAPADGHMWPGATGGARILYVGRLEYEKGVHVLLRAVRRLRTAGRPVRLVVAGDGTHRDELERLTGRLRVRRSTAFLGFCDGPALDRLQAAADVAVVPSLYEPFGIAALEAMAAGTPLVATRTGGLAELVDDARTGLLVAPDDAAALADAIGRLLDDPALARRLVEAGERRAATASWDDAARRTSEVYARARRTRVSLR